MDILVYGDSLTVNAQYAGGLVASGESVAVRARVGTALCDWAPGMAADRKDYKPKTVVIAFAGNAATCVADDYHRHGADGATANYERALRTARTAFPTEKVVVISPIAMHDLIGSLPYVGNPQLATMYKRVAAEIYATYSLAADDALTPHHVFAWTRPPLGCPACRPVPVRMPDGVHLTTAGGKLYGAALLK
ncbi:MAG: SGNH/GDSL hydrolase family protein [Frankiaceae bacterium]